MKGLFIHKILLIHQLALVFTLDPSSSSLDPSITFKEEKTKTEIINSEQPKNVAHINVGNGNEASPAEIKPAVVKESGKNIQENQPKSSFTNSTNESIPIPSIPLTGETGVIENVQNDESIPDENENGNSTFASDEFDDFLPSILETDSVENDSIEDIMLPDDPTILEESISGNDAGSEKVSVTEREHAVSGDNNGSLPVQNAESILVNSSNIHEIIQKRLDSIATEDTTLLASNESVKTDETFFTTPENLTEFADDHASKNDSELTIGETIDDDILPNSCSKSDEQQIYGNPDNCQEYFISCLKPNPIALPEFPGGGKNASLLQLEERYNLSTETCPDDYNFDGIESICLPKEIAVCNETYATFCSPDNDLIFPQYRVDPNNPTIFIECFPENKTAKRETCQPKGTIFDEDLQSCINNFTEIQFFPETNETLTDSEKGDTLSLKILRLFIWVISRTEEKLSPWMEKVNVTEGNFSEEFIPSNFTFSDEEEDEILILTKDPWLLSLYYGVIFSIALVILLIWGLTVFACYKCCCCCKRGVMKKEDPNDMDVFGFGDYNLNDRYVMTRL